MFDAEIRISVDVDMPAPPGLRYVCDNGPAIQRRRAGKGFVYLDAKGRRVANPDTLQRIRSLVIPPAWAKVWICASANGHIQATGRDAKGRKQYKYHAEYREAREQSKYEHLFAFAAALPTIRAMVAEHMSLRGLPREKVLATVVHLLERTLIRVGNDEYARNNQSYGLTTLKSDHVEVDGSEVRFQFTGKSGKQWSLAMRDRRVARIVRACQELPGQDLLQYFNEDKELHAVSSGDVDAYLREIAGCDVTAKDFRTWAGTMLMARYLAVSGPFASATQAKRVMSAAVKKVAAALGNTAAVCRKSYIHPAISDAYLSGAFVLRAMEENGASKAAGLMAEEIAVLALLKVHDAGSQRERGAADFTAHREVIGCRSRLNEGAMASFDSKTISHLHHELHSHLPSEPALRTKALESLLAEKKLIDPAAVDAWIEMYRDEIGPKRGAAVVARAWRDPAFKARLLADGTAAIGEFGFAGHATGHLQAVENTADVHNLVVCTLCSCYPFSILGLSPSWYKSNEYRARVVRDPRGVLEEFGVKLDESMQVRVWDSTSERRYIVVPQRPEGVEDWDEAMLANLVTRNSMIGTERDLSPSRAEA